MAAGAVVTSHKLRHKSIGYISGICFSLLQTRAACATQRPLPSRKSSSRLRRGALAAVRFGSRWRGSLVTLSPPSTLAPHTPQQGPPSRVKGSVFSSLHHIFGRDQSGHHSPAPDHRFDVAGTLTCRPASPLNLSIRRSFRPCSLFAPRNHGPPVSFCQVFPVSVTCTRARIHHFASRADASSATAILQGGLVPVLHDSLMSAEKQSDVPLA